MSKVKFKKKINFETSILEYGKVNSGFAKVKISIMTDSQVANGTSFKKEVINKKRGTLNYLPVVGQFKKENEDFGDHGEKIEITNDGIEFIKETIPYGVVMADTARWENVQKKNGETVEYLVADAYLWIEISPELEVLYDGKLNNQSMEIKILDGKFNEDTWVYEVEDFEFVALCILGKHVEPAFDEARIDVNFSEDCFEVSYQKMITALDKYFKNYEQGEVEDLAKNKDKTVEDNATTEEVEVIEEETDLDDTTVVETDEVEDTSTEDETTETDEEVEVDESTDDVDYKEEYKKIQEELALLKEFKSSIELEEKNSIVDTFKHRYSLEDEDLKDVVSKINTYSTKQVEDELCIIAFKKGKTSSYTKDVKKPFKSALLDNYNSNEDSTVGVKAILQRRK